MTFFIRLISISFIVLLVSSVNAFSQQFELIWSEEFNQTELDEGIWNPWEGTAYNNEWQYYTPREKNIYVEDGMLYLVGLRENYQGQSWTSARINTQGNFEFQYGKVEIRAKLPLGKGLWPAFWMLGSNIEDDQIGWPYSGEIDIMEYRGHLPYQTNGTIHFAAEAPEFPRTQNEDHRYIGEEYNLPSGDFTEDFHLFQFEWSDSLLVWSIDDVEFYRLTREEIEARTSYYPFDQPFYIILNLAIGGDFLGNQQPDETTPDRNEVIVDYVRIYQDTNKDPEVETGLGSSETVKPYDLVELSAQATDEDGNIERVEFIMNENVIAVDSVAPYHATWRPGIDGCYDFQVKAYDNFNNMGSSTQETVFIVGTGCEKRAFNDDPQPFPGTLQFEHYDYGGLDNAYNDTSPDTNLGNSLGNEFRDTEAVDLIPDENQEGNHLLTELEVGEWTTYQIEITQSGIYDLELRAVGGSQSGRLDFTIDDEDLVYYTRLVARDGEPYISKTITDVELTEGTYELKMEVVQDGNGLKPDRLKAILTESITSNESSRGIPSTVTLYQNYPNPFNPNTNISFSLDQPQHTHLSIYNSLGQHIKTLYSGTLMQGSHSFSFDASGYSSGIYYYQLTSSSGTWTRQMLLLK